MSAAPVSEQALVAAVRAFFWRAVRSDKFKAEQRELIRAELGELTKDVPHYEGTWCDGSTYERSACVTFDGSLWIALEHTDARPGRDSTWRLCVKRGRDGKDAR
jgi:hypothetical protein